MNRIIALAAFAIFSSAAMAQYPSQTYSAASGDSIQLHQQVQSANELYLKIKQDQARLEAAQNAFWDRVAAMAKSQTDISDIMRVNAQNLDASKRQIAALQGQVSALQGRIDELTVTLSDAENDAASFGPGNAAIAPQEAVTSVSAGISSMGAEVDNHCKQLASGDRATWRTAVTGLLPEYSFEEFDKKHGVIWIKRPQAENVEGLKVGEVMAKLGCHPQ